MRWSKEQYDAYKTRRQASGAKPESVVCDGSLAESKTQERNPSRSIIRITSFRTRLIDPDNLCAKYFVDGLRYAGIIPDDRPQDIELTVTQEKVATIAEERTEIEITKP